MLLRTITLLLGLSIAFLLASSQVALSKTSHKAHTHGHAKLDIAVDGVVVKMMLEAPAESIFGFEHAAKTSAQKQALADGTAKLKATTQLFALPTDYGCEASAVTIKNPLADDKPAASKAHNHDKHHHGHDDNTHSDVDAVYSFTCKKPLDGAMLTINLSKVFPRMKEVKYQLISGTKQTGGELSAKKVSVEL